MENYWEYDTACFLVSLENSIVRHAISHPKRSQKQRCPEPVVVFCQNMWARLPRLEQRGSHNQDLIAILGRAVVANSEYRNS